MQLMVTEGGYPTSQHNDGRGLIWSQPKVRRLMGPVKSHVGLHCHFCGHKIKLFHKYVQLTELEFMYVAHKECYGYYMFTDPRASRVDIGYPPEKWGHEHEHMRNRLNKL